MPTNKPKKSGKRRNRRRDNESIRHVLSESLPLPDCTEEIFSKLSVDPSQSPDARTSALASVFSKYFLLGILLEWTPSAGYNSSAGLVGVRYTVEESETLPTTTAAFHTQVINAGTASRIFSCKRPARWMVPRKFIRNITEGYTPGATNTPGALHLGPLATCDLSTPGTLTAHITYKFWGKTTPANAAVHSQPSQLGWDYGGLTWTGIAGYPTWIGSIQATMGAFFGAQWEDLRKHPIYMELTAGTCYMLNGLYTKTDPPPELLTVSGGGLLDDDTILGGVTNYATGPITPWPTNQYVRARDPIPGFVTNSVSDPVPTLVTNPEPIPSLVSNPDPIPTLVSNPDPIPTLFTNPLPIEVEEKQGIAKSVFNIATGVITTVVKGGSDADREVRASSIPVIATIPVGGTIDGVAPPPVNVSGDSVLTYLGCADIVGGTLCGAAITALVEGALPDGYSAPPLGQTVVQWTKKIRAVSSEGATYDYFYRYYASQINDAGEATLTPARVMESLEDGSVYAGQYYPEDIKIPFSTGGTVTFYSVPGKYSTPNYSPSR